MNHLFTFFYILEILGAIVQNPIDPIGCELNIGGLAFFQPYGFEITNTWAKNGVLSMFDKASGNGIDIVVDTKSVDMDKKILSIREEWSKSILNEEKTSDSGHIFRIKNASKIQPVDTIILLPKQAFILEAYEMRTGDQKTHGAFEDSALTVLRSIEQGGTNESRAYQCFSGFVYGLGRNV